MFHGFDNVMYLFECQNYVFMYYYVFHVFLHLSLFLGYNMNLYFGPAALHYIITISYLILSY